MTETKLAEIEGRVSCAYHVRPDGSCYIVFGSVASGPHCQADCDLPEHHVKLLVDAYNERAALLAQVRAMAAVLTRWDDMITNCAGVPQNPDSLPMMLRYEIRQQIAALAAGGGTEGDGK